ncbi:MAG: glycosyltransferase family 39 protein [Candidatus Nanoarchaeia archaeon]
MKNIKKITSWMNQNIGITLILVMLIVFSLVLKINEANVGAGDEFPGSDAWGYHNNAIEFLKGEKPISSYFNPLETLYLIPIYAIFGPNLFIAKFIQILFSFLIPFFLYFVTKRYFGKTAGFIAAALSLVHPFILYYSAHLWSEFWIIFFFSLLLYLFVLEQEQEKLRIGRIILLGVVGGIGALAKIWFLPLAFLAVFFIVFQKQKKLKIIMLECAKHFGLVVLGMLIIIIPWSIYASHHADYFVLINTNSKTNLYIGNNPDGEVAYTSKPYTFEYSSSVDLQEGNCGYLLNSTTGSKNDYYFKKCAGKYAVNYIFEHPGKFIAKMTKFTFNYWAFPNLEYFQRYIRSPKTLLFTLWVFWALALIGIFASIQKSKDFLFFYLAILGIWFVHGLTFYLARYKSGLTPMVILFAAGGIYTLWYLLFSKKAKS